VCLTESLSMTTELTILAWVLILALVQIIVAAHLRTRETGVAYNAGARDKSSPAPIGVLTGRLLRAQNNLLETLPLFIAAVLIAHAAAIHTSTTEWAARLYLIGRLAYLPLYAFGVPVLRSLAWLVSIAGILMLIVSALTR